MLLDVTVSIDDALHEAKSHLRTQCEQVHPKMLALQVVRMADWAYVLPPEIAGRMRAAAIYGAPLLLSILPAAPLSEPGWAPLVSNESIERATAGLILRASDVARVERMVALARSGLGEVVARDGVVHIEFGSNAFGSERHDTRDEEHLRLWRRSLEVEEDEELRRLEPQVAKLTSKLVDRWYEHFIQYGADPLLDEYFDRKATLYCSLMAYRDVFDEHAPFGGVAFKTYIDAVAALAALALKHVVFSEALLAKYPEMRAPNALTIVDEPPKLLDSIAAQLDESCVPDVRKALRALTHRLEEDHGLLVPGENLAPLIEIGEGFVVRSLSGMLGGPVYYLLKYLRRNHRRDWDVAVNRREAAFREDIHAIFPRPHFRIGKCPGKLRRGGRVVTDIDAAVFDPQEKTLALFQLKWQDPFGMSANERRSRATNLVSTGNDWVARVLDWTEEHGIDALQRALQLPREPVAALRLFVCARSHANFSGALPYDPRAAWGTWAQLARLHLANPSGPDCIGRIHDGLLAEFRRRRPAPSGPLPIGEAIDLGTTRVRVVIQHGVE
jgi:hypothetical protein